MAAGYVYLLYGTDRFTRDEQVRSLKERMRALPAGEHNLSDLRGQEVALAQVIETCGAAPFLAARRMVVVDGLLARLAGGSRGRKLGDVEPFLDAIEALPETTALVLVEDSLDPSVVEALRERVAEPRFVPRMFGRRDDLGSWIRQRAQAAGGTIDPDAVRELVRLCQDDTAQLANEVEKLVAYCRGRAIGVADVEELVAPSGETNAFALLDALADGDRGSALAVYQRLSRQGERPEAVLGQVGGFVRRLSVMQAALDEDVTPGEAAKRAEINPRTVDRLVGQARRFTPEQLRQAYGLLLEADRLMKTGERGASVAVELVLADFPIPAPRAGGVRAAAR